MIGHVAASLGRTASICSDERTATESEDGRKNQRHDPPALKSHTFRMRDQPMRIRGRTYA